MLTKTNPLLHYSSTINYKPFIEMKAITIEGNTRSNVGKKETNNLRKQGNIPCSIYGGSENVNFYAPVNAFKELVYTPEFYTAQINVDGKQLNCVLQDIQFHPIS